MQKRTSKSAKSAPVTVPIVSENQDFGYGFFGCLRSNYGLSNREAAEVYNQAGQFLVSGRLVATPADAVAGLDSRYGRHLADSLHRLVGPGCEDVAPLVSAVICELTGSAKTWSKAFAVFAA